MLYPGSPSSPRNQVCVPHTAPHSRFRALRNRSHFRKAANLILFCVLSFLQCTKRLAKENPLRSHLYRLPSFSLKPKFHYHINNSPSLDAILSQVNPTLTSPHSFFTIHLTIILPTPKGFEWSPHSKSSNQRVRILV